MAIADLSAGVRLQLWRDVVLAVYDNADVLFASVAHQLSPLKPYRTSACWARRCAAAQSRAHVHCAQDQYHNDERAKPVAQFLAPLCSGLQTLI